MVDVGAGPVAGRAAAAVAVAAFAWWAAGLAPFTTPSLVAVVGGGLVAMAAGARWLPRRPTPVEGAAPPAGLAAWAVLVVALAAWELAAYVQHPRADHPTLSSLANDALRPRVVRAAALAGWLAVAARLARP